MDSRAQFEEWFKTHWVEKVANMSMFERHRLQNLAWMAWQASRAAIVVELPEKISEHNRNENGYVLPHASSYDEAIDDCAEGVMAAGISIKLRNSYE